MDNNLINIKSYPKPKKEGGGNANITYNINGADIGSNLKLKSLQVNRIMSDYIETNNIDAGTGNFVYLVASDGTISSLRGDNLDYNSGRIGDFKSDNIETNKLNVKDTATITNIFNNYLNSKEIVTDYLTVNKAAHFFEVVVDKIRSVGGTIINTATSCVIDYVEPYYGDGLSAPLTGYKCYWKQTNNEDEYVSNDWMVGDQAISQNCNIVAGVNHNTSNHYYWRLVSEVSNSTKYVNFDTGETSDGELVDGEYVAPQYKVQFKGIVNGQNFNGFKYDNGLTGEDKLVVDSWNITSQIDGDWNSANEILTVEDTLHGLQLIPNDINNRYPNIRRGSFTFRTTQPTRLNVMILFDNDTVEYHPSTEQQNDYNIQIVNPNNALINMIVITSDVVDVWHACHWIVLSDRRGEYDVPEVHDDLDPDDPRYDEDLFGDDVVDWDNVPAKGDNIAQLGFRYGPNPTQDQINRASAIIIAAYKTPDSGGTINGRTIQPIKPPSYAQYQRITDFNLFTHRGTYMDSSGTYIKGNLVSESGSTVSVDDVLDASVEYYSIICGQNPIVRPATGTKDVNVNVLKVVNGDGEICGATALQDWYMSLNGSTSDVSGPYGTTSAYFTFDVGITGTNTADLKLYDGDDKLKDNVVVSIVDLENVTDGKNGDYTDFIWKYADEEPIEPNNYFIPWEQYNMDMRNGWSDDGGDPTDGKYLWMSQRTVEGVVGGYNYSNWTVPVRVNGEDGINGKDGSEIEFIYKRFATGPQTFTGQDNPANWGAEQEPDYLGPSGYEWNDQPQGVSTSYPYEYMSQRKYYGVPEEWDTFTEPVLWSKYGENGMDGDGVEYIFCLSDSESDVPTIIQHASEATGVSSDYYTTDSGGGIASWTDGTNTYQQNTNEYLPISGGNRGVPYTDWTDDPSGVSQATGCKVEWVSQRRYDGEHKKWLDFSEPAVWAKWSEDGATGPQGPTGPTGENGIVDKLIPVVELFEVRTSSTDDYNDIQSKLYTNLEYQVFHVDGDVVSKVTDLSDYSIRSYVKSINGTIKTFNVGTGGWSVTPINTYQLGEWDNILTHLSLPVGVPTDYRTLSQNSTYAGDYLPINMQIDLLVGNQVVDSKILDVTFKAGHIFEVTDQALNTAFFGSWAGISGTVNGISTITQTMQGIETNVSTLERGVSGLNSDYSTFKQTSQGFQTRVESDYYESGSTNPKITYSIIDQRAGSISASVQSDVEGKLQRTGIDIIGVTGTQGGTITLQADKVTFTNSAGTVNNKISINPTTGTLNATDGNFDGIIHAQMMYSSSYNIPSTTTNINLNESGTTIYNQYLKQGNSGNVTHIYLPEPNDYPGLEINFFCFTNASPTDFIGNSNYSIRIHRHNSSSNALRVNDISFTAAYYNSTTLGTLYVGQNASSTYTQVYLDNTAVSITGADYIDIMPNKLCTMKSISGRWYQIQGSNMGMGYATLD